MFTFYQFQISWNKKQVKEKVHKFEDKVIELTQPAASTPFATSPALRYVADVDVSQKVGAIQTDGARPPLPASHYNVMQQLEKSVSVISRPVDSSPNSNVGQTYNPLTGPSVFEQEDFITPEASTLFCTHPHWAVLFFVKYFVQSIYWSNKFGMVKFYKCHIIVLIF